jgi:hypothetical protein
MDENYCYDDQFSSIEDRLCEISKQLNEIISLLKETRSEYE